MNGNKQGSQCETIYLPYHESELQKSLERLGITEERQLEQVELKIYECDVDPRLEHFLEGQPLSFANLAHMNTVATNLGELYQQESKNLVRFMEIMKIDTLEDLATLSENYQDLSFHRNVNTPGEYAELLLDEVLDFHDKASDYIDFDGFGQAKLEDYDCIFTEEGLLIYHGHDVEMSMLMEIAEGQNQGMGYMT